MLRKRDLLKKINNLNEEVNKLQAQIYDMKYPNGELYTSYDLYGGKGYLRYSYAYNEKIAIVTICTATYGLREFKFERNNDRTFIGTKIMINNELVEKYYVVDLHKRLVVETTNVEQLSNIEWTDKIISNANFNR